MAEVNSEIEKSRKRRSGRKAIQAKKTVIDGIKFDSMAEAKRYHYLNLSEMAGIISNLECHPKYPLKVNNQLITTYSPDFRYQDKHGNLIVEDVKGKPKTKKAEKYLKGTANWTRFRLCVKLMKALHDIDVEVVYV